MSLQFRSYRLEDFPLMRQIWNQILDDGMVFPGVEELSPEAFANDMEANTLVTVLLKDQVLAGYYAVKPNNIGRCSHTANASDCMNPDFRGQGLFQVLVEESLKEAKAAGFHGMQFNAVVANNYAALRTYTHCGFTIVGTIPQGFQIKDGTYLNMYVMHKAL